MEAVTPGRVITSGVSDVVGSCGHVCMTRPTPRVKRAPSSSGRVVSALARRAATCRPRPPAYLGRGGRKSVHSPRALRRWHASLAVFLDQSTVRASRWLFYQPGPGSPVESCDSVPVSPGRRTHSLRARRSRGGGRRLGTTSGRGDPPDRVPIGRGGSRPAVPGSVRSGVSGWSEGLVGAAEAGDLGWADLGEPAVDWSGVLVHHQYLSRSSLRRRGTRRRFLGVQRGDVRRCRGPVGGRCCRVGSAR